MKEDYNIYRDCICIDTTYQTNKYNFPLITFTGINNEGVLLVFGKLITILL